MHVITVIGDIIGSKTLSRRAAFQKKLEQVLQARSAGASGLASPFTVTLGDEFQAVYRSADSIWADCVEILAALHPVEARFAFGVGELSTRLNSERALGMDGPAFHRARAALTAMKGSDHRFVIAAADEKRWALANHCMALVSHHLAGWTDTRLRILAGLLRGRSVRELEPALKISKVAVYKNIHAAALDEIVAICHELGHAMNTELRNA